MRLILRILVTVLAIGLVIVTGVHYGMMANQHWPYPNSDDLARKYNDYVGETTLLWGTVMSVERSAKTAKVRVEYSGGSFTLTVHDFEAEVEPGGSVQVLGRLMPRYELTADRIVVVNPSDEAELLKFGISMLGVLLFLLVFFRHWRIDWDRLTLEAR